MIHSDKSKSALLSPQFFSSCMMTFIGAVILASDISEFHSGALIPALLTAAGTVGIIFSARNELHRRKLMKNGARITAAVISLVPDPSLSINGYPAFILTCSAEIDGRSRVFVRKNLRKKQAASVKETAAVCYNKENPDEYCIEL